MEHIKAFFDTSTIHGLSWISGTRQWSRFFWILIVIGGFSGAGYLIYESFYNWGKSPVSTTTETLPISQITFPNVTVCPPKNSFLNLNSDIKESENKSFENDALFEYAFDVLQDEFYKETIRNLSKLDDPDRYYNWYLGYTRIQYPYYDSKISQLHYDVHTSTTSGNISTLYFGDKLDVDNVDGNILIQIFVNVPTSRVKEDNNVTLMVEVNKRTMKDVSDDDQMKYNLSTIDPDVLHWSKNITKPSGFSQIKLDRKVSADDIKNIEFDFMPGFRLTWKYNKHVELENTYSNRIDTKQFVRSVFLSIYSS